jgi:hypothetical protein
MSIEREYTAGAGAYLKLDPSPCSLRMMFGF